MHAEGAVVRETWRQLQRLEALKRALKVAGQCRKGYYYYNAATAAEDEVGGVRRDRYLGGFLMVALWGC